MVVEKTTAGTHRQPVGGHRDSVVWYTASGRYCRDDGIISEYVRTHERAVGGRTRRESMCAMASNLAAAQHQSIGYPLMMALKAAYLKVRGIAFIYL